MKRFDVPFQWVKWVFERPQVVSRVPFLAPHLEVSGDIAPRMREDIAVPPPRRSVAALVKDILIGADEQTNHKINTQPSSGKKL